MSSKESEKKTIKDNIYNLYEEFQKRRFPPESLQKLSRLANKFEDDFFDTLPLEYIKKFKPEDFTAFVCSLMAMICAQNFIRLHDVFHLSIEEIMDIFHGKLVIALKLKEIKRNFPDIFKHH